MKSIFASFKGLNKDGKPLDLLATWKKTFDKASEREVTLFQKMYCDEWFDYETPQMDLTADYVVGKYNIRFMATLLADESPTPNRRSDGFDVWTEEIPRVGHKFPMKARDYRKILSVYENPRIKESAKVKAIEKTLTHDIQDAYLGCKDVMDFIILAALSNNGVAQFKPDINNPGGRSYEVDYRMSEENKIVSTYNWTDANAKAGNVNPILILSLICSNMRNRGIEPGEILMSQDLYFWMRNNYATRLMWYGKDKVDKTVNKTDFESLLSENEIPAVTVVKRKMGIDKDGKRNAIEPWNHNFIAIKPSGKIGRIQPAIEDNALMEEEGVDYMDAGNGMRIAKWRTGESTNQQAAEFTQGSWRAIPLIEEINQIYCIQVRGYEEKIVKDTYGTILSYVTKAEYDKGSANVINVG